MALITSGLAAAVLGMSLGAALLVGTAVCPTDPVLASSVVTAAPGRVLYRRSAGRTNASADATAGPRT